MNRTEFIEHLEYTNAYVFRYRGKNYKVTADKKVQLPDETWFPLGRWEDVFRFPLPLKKTIGDLVDALQVYEDFFIYDIDHRVSHPDFPHLTVTSYGHSCFRVENEGVSIVFDPYQKDSVPGMQLPANITANAVLCSHEHADHNARESVRIVEGKEDSFSLEQLDVPHDNQHGNLRGRNKISIVSLHGFKIVHFGDLGRNLYEEEMQKLKNADLVMIPVGGYYTIDSDTAFTILEAIRPKTAILMHYCDGKAGYPVLEDIHTICAHHPEIIQVCSDEIDISSDTYPKWITMQRKTD